MFLWGPVGDDNPIYCPNNNTHTAVLNSNRVLIVPLKGDEACHVLVGYLVSLDLTVLHST